MADTRGRFPDTLEEGLREYVVDVFEHYPLEIDRVFTIFNSSKAWEEFKDSWSFGLLEETPEGSNAPADLYQDGYYTRISYKTYSKKHIITWAEYHDDLYGIFKDRSPKMTRQATDTVNSQAFSVFRNAFSTSYLSYGDDKPLCSTNHTRPDGGTAQSNASSTGITLTEANLETADLAVREVKDGRGNLLNFMGEKGLLLVPPALKKEALIITQSTLRSGTANNDLNYYLGNWDVLVSAWISEAAGGSDTAWFVILPNICGLVFIWREKPYTYVEMDKDNRNLEIFIWASFGYGWRWWYGIWGSKGDGAAYSD